MEPHKFDLDATLKLALRAIASQMWSEAQEHITILSVYTYSISSNARVAVEIPDWLIKGVAPKYEVSISHIDTCAPEFLTDHHNRKGEMLVGIPVGSNTTRVQVMEELIEALVIADRIPEAIDHGMIADAVKAEFIIGPRDGPFDASLEVPDDKEDNDIQAWFLLTWMEE